MRALVERLASEHRLSKRDLVSLLSSCDEPTLDLLRDKATRTAHEQFGFGIYLRGLIEISSYCKNDCLYCGLRRSNRNAERYRLSDKQILECCQIGYNLGLRTFVLQGGEDSLLSDQRLESLIGEIHSRYPDAAITLSLGERPLESLQRLRQAGASRYLLRHEAADAQLYAAIHHAEMSHASRLQTINELMQLGFQTGVGMMIGVPMQSIESIAEDLLYIERTKPQMVGIGPFIPHHDTPFKDYPAGDLRLTLMAIAITRLLLPKALIPATTALATLSKEGVKKGILSGANVVMPNLSPAGIRAKYAIYDNKASREGQSAEGIEILSEELKSIGYHIDFSKGDF
ncbi:MAG: [FeFe] hydrogenase H-cluster radical SAM maturase HydE [Alistipes sp.]|nr:[FeFe] hydrogenase H-cluster radical SAM maturase HydE [Alistipes sp.]